jgi:methylenetetrahydrofolate reductase (NADPH)
MGESKLTLFSKVISVKKIQYRLDQLKDSVPVRPQAFSFEFFPPKNADMEVQLKNSIIELANLGPDFMTVTYGAGGSTKDRTAEIASYIQQKTGVSAAAHITSVNATKETIHEVLDDYIQKGIKRIVALRGDMPGFEGVYEPMENGYAYAKDLVEAIAAMNAFEISVAGYPETHPQATSEKEDLGYLKAKVDAGAARIITQYCFNTDQVLRYVEKVQKLGVTVPVVPGIMLISHFKQMCRFSEQCGASIPKWLSTLCDGVDEDPYTRSAMAVVVAAEQCRLLMQEGIDQFHFYSLNRHETAKAVCRLLGVTNG